MPERSSASVSAPPARSGRPNAMAKRRAGPANGVAPIARALWSMPPKARARASAAAATHTASQVCGVRWPCATQAATSAKAPMATCAQPDTVVKEAACSMVRRM